MTVFWLQLVPLIVITFYNPVDTQDFPLVNFNDTEALITNTVTKSYVTTIGLTPIPPATRLDTSIFLQAISQFYSQTNGGAGIPGIITIEEQDISYEIVDSSLFVVTYTVRYSLSILRGSGITDDDISNTIGNYDVLRPAVGSTDNLLSLSFIVQESDENFAFTGLPVCGDPDVTCNGTQLTCSENLSGVSVFCVSPCKIGFCQNGGTCAQENVNTSPTCTCRSKSDVWFLGENCQTMVSLWMVIVVVVGCVILIIVAIILACCFYKKRRRKKEKEAGFLEVPRSNGYSNKSFVNTEANINNPVPQNGFQARIQPRTDPIISPPSHSPAESRTPRTRDRSYSFERRRRSYDNSPSRRSRRSGSTSAHTSSDTESHQSGSTAGSTPSFTPSTSRVNARTGSTTSQDFANMGLHDVNLSTRDQGTSPIRWLPSTRSPQTTPGTNLGKIDIAQRKGWLPSLGPKMFDLEEAHAKNSPSGNASHSILDTDI